jgi:hypothetical protein
MRLLANRLSQPIRDDLTSRARPIVRLSDHVFRRGSSNSLTTEEVYHCLRHGDLVDVDNHSKGLAGRLQLGDLFVVVNFPRRIVVTAYRYHVRPDFPLDCSLYYWGAVTPEILTELGIPRTKLDKEVTNGLH